MIVTIYTASKVKHAAKWRELRHEGARTGQFCVLSTWIDEADDGDTESYPDLWRRCVHEAKTASALLLYVERGEVLKGALVEVGAALAAGVPVHIVGAVDQIGSWVYHSLVRLHATVEQAVRSIISNTK